MPPQLVWVLTSRPLLLALFCALLTSPSRRPLPLPLQPRRALPGAHRAPPPRALAHRALRRPRFRTRHAAAPPPLRARAMEDALAPPGAPDDAPDDAPPLPSPPASPTDALLPSLGKVERHRDSVFGVVQPRNATLLYASPNAGRVFAAPPGGLVGCVLRGRARARATLARAAQLRAACTPQKGNSHRTCKAVCAVRRGAKEARGRADARARVRDGARRAVARRCSLADACSAEAAPAMDALLACVRDLPARPPPRRATVRLRGRGAANAVTWTEFKLFSDVRAPARGLPFRPACARGDDAAAARTFLGSHRFLAHMRCARSHRNKTGRVRVLHRARREQREARGGDAALLPPHNQARARFPSRLSRNLQMPFHGACI
jgi:hypothetical protein